MTADVAETQWEWREIGGLETNCSASDFLSAVEVWVRRPQVVNRRLLGAVIVEEEATKELKLEDRLQSDGMMTGAEEHSLIRELLPRVKSVAPRREIVSTIKDILQTSVTFDPMGVSESSSMSRGWGSYMLQHCSGNPNRITVSIYCSVKREAPSCDGRTDSPWTLDKATSSRPNGVTTPTSEWLHSVLLPKVLQWAEEGESGQSPRQQPLVPLGQYCSLYRHLKEKYGPTLVQEWPEATDPHKFVYEDIAIATYLILLWEEEKKELALTEKQTFIDLGCGNGLLVYLLSSEGVVNGTLLLS
jgi:tRNASer (uridine44-2'-O)-methyltransferase